MMWHKWTIVPKTTTIRLGLETHLKPCKFFFSSFFYLNNIFSTVYSQAGCKAIPTNVNNDSNDGTISISKGRGGGLEVMTGRLEMLVISFLFIKYYY